MENSRNARAQRCMSGWKYAQTSLRTPVVVPQKYRPRSCDGSHVERHGMHLEGLGAQPDSAKEMTRATMNLMGPPRIVRVMLDCSLLIVTVA